MIILHGEDTTKSYQRLIELTENMKARQCEVLIHDEQDIDITSFRQEIGSSDLFGSTKCIVVKNFLSGTKSKNKERLIDVIKSNNHQEIIFWDSKMVSVTMLRSFPEAKVENFSISPVIFKFLDSLRPGNTKQIVLSWKKLLDEDTEPEFVFAMLVRQIKLLIQAKSAPVKLKLAPYPARLISTQATYFTIDHLLELYRQLYDIDLKIKTGKSSAVIDILLSHFLQKI
jgi:DNA polymerase III delta subunit